MPENKPILIKKYSNRRLYNTQTSCYINLEDLCQMIKDGADFLVMDAKTGEDLTRITLTQIIFEQESKGYNILPLNFLKHIIKFYDQNINTSFSRYLDMSMENFTKNQNFYNQNNFLEQMEKTSKFFEEITKNFFNPKK